MKKLTAMVILIGTLYYGFLVGKCYVHFQTVIDNKLATINYLGEIR